MDIFMNVLTAIGGLAFFLFGMNMLGDSLEKAAGSKMEQLLEKMTSNVFKSLFLGLAVTAVIQSSSATTVIVVGLVNAGVLRLRNAIGVIMGANIGTTVTAMIVSLADPSLAESTNAILAFFKPATFTPIIAIIAVIITMVTKKSNIRAIAEIMLGLAILFNGMLTMNDALGELAELPIFQQIFQTLTNPFLGLAAGLIITAIIQSSSASVAILQTAASTGLVPFSAAAPIILGQNIGTTVTSLLASIGTSKNARRASFVHVYFNIIGSILFFIGMYAIEWTIGMPGWNEPITMGGIAIFHLTFNLVTTAVLLPFTSVLEKLAIFTVREDKKAPGEEEEEENPVITAMDERLLLSPGLALAHAKDAIETMGEYAARNFKRSISLFTKYDPDRKAKINAFEDAIDKMEDKINHYLIALTNQDLTDHDSRTVTYYLKLVMEFERIGDYAVNVMELAERLNGVGAKLSDKALNELHAISDAVSEAIGMSVSAVKTDDVSIAARIEPLEETVDKMEDTLKFRHIDRLKEGKCTIDGGVVFLELLTNIERISDHCSNIAVHVIGYRENMDSLDRHAYLKEIHAGESQTYSDLYNGYNEKYFSRI